MVRLMIKLAFVLILSIPITGCVAGLADKKEPNKTTPEPVQEEIVVQPESEPEEKPVVAEKEPVEPKEIDLQVIVAKGNTLGQVSRQFTGTVNNWNAILDYNSLDDPKKMKIGQLLKIPAELLLPRYKNTTHVIQMEPEATEQQPK